MKIILDFRNHYIRTTDFLQKHKGQKITSTNTAGTTGYPFAKKKFFLISFDPYITLPTKIISRQITDLNA